MFEFENEEGNPMAVFDAMMQLSSDRRLSGSFERFRKAADELEKAGFDLERAVMVKRSMDAGLCGYSAG